MTENKKCPNCRWYTKNICTNQASEYSLFEIVSLEFEDTTDCEQYYPNNDLELFGDSDEVTGRFCFDD